MNITIRLLLLVSCVGCQPANTGRDEPTELSSSSAKIDGLARALSSGDVEERRAAAYELGQTNDPNAVPHAIAGLDDPDLDVRVNAIQSLRDLKDARAVNRLIEIFTDQSSEPLIVSNVMDAFGSIRSPLAIPALTAALQSDDKFIRFDAAYALGEIGDPSAIPALRKLLSDKTKPEFYDDDGVLRKSTIYTIAQQAQRAIDMIQAN